MRSSELIPSVRGVVEVHLVGATDADRTGRCAIPFRALPRRTSRMRRQSSCFGRPTCSSSPCRIFPPGVRAGIVPGKTYEYMASGTPILAAVPDGDAREMLRSVGTATVCRPADGRLSRRRARAADRRLAGGRSPARAGSLGARPLRTASADLRARDRDSQGRRTRDAIRRVRPESPRSRPAASSPRGPVAADGSAVAARARSGARPRFDTAACARMRLRCSPR